MSTKPPIASLRYARECPTRIHVWSAIFGDTPWTVNRGTKTLFEANTHAEAIAYADLVARRDV